MNIVWLPLADCSKWRLRSEKTSVGMIEFLTGAHKEQAYQAYYSIISNHTVSKLIILVHAATACRHGASVKLMVGSATLYKLLYRSQ